MLFSFIDEVVRKEEMRTAARSGSSRPIGNWIFQFVTFADIVDALRIQLNIDASIGEAAALGNLRREVVSNLQLLLDKSKDRIMAGHCCTDFLSGYNLDDYEGETSIPSGKLVWALIYMLTGFSIASRLSGRYAHEIIKTGQLQQLDHQTGTLSQTPLGEAVLELLDQIESLKRIDTIIDPQRAILAAQYRPLAVSESMELVSLPNELLFMLRSAHDRHQDIVHLSKAIVRAIDGDDSLIASVQLQPVAASQRMTEELEREIPSTDELEEWIKA